MCGLTTYGCRNLGLLLQSPHLHYGVNNHTSIIKHSWTLKQMMPVQCGIKGLL